MPERVNSIKSTDKHYGEFHALKDVNLKMPDDQLLVGCGHQNQENPDRSVASTGWKFIHQDRSTCVVCQHATTAARYLFDHNAFSTGSTSL